MDGNAQSFSPSYSQPESPKIYLPKPAGATSSGLTLVIPSLKSLKASQSFRTPKHRSGSLSHSGSVFPDVDNQEKKAPRPVKLKPLKEVLTKLVSQIKKKDDYAFFLYPVDARNIPGYSDVVKHPMDLGTMTEKVNRGKYRSLEDFTSDFRLVTMNAKIFNPPGSIYHTEAERIEAWGLDHISKAFSTVIQYETDWNIDVEKEDEGQPVIVDDDEEDNTGTPMDVDSTSLRERSVSVASQVQPGPSSRRGPRGPYKKQGQSAPSSSLSEALEPDGGLPGSKDGIGAFPPGSDWAKTMISLKLKGKRYKTKKERMRIERDGPPLLPDGSLDYSEMEDPFSVLSSLVPESPSRPQLVPIYPPLYNPTSPPPLLQFVSDPSSSQTPQPHSLPPPPPPPPLPTFPSAIIVPADHTTPTLPFLEPPPASSSQPRPRRHWVVNRNANSRQKGKEKDDELDAFDLPAWQMPRDLHATDFGSFAPLSGALAEEVRRRGLTSANPGLEMDLKGNLDREINFSLIRNSLDSEAAAKAMEVDGGLAQTWNPSFILSKAYWTAQRAAEAEEFLRDTVYGGVDGFAYVRSLAEFVDGDCYHKEESTCLPSIPPRESGLGMRLAQWIVGSIIDPLTEGRHSLIREAALELSRQRDHKPQNAYADPREGTVDSQVTASLHLFPATLIALSALLHIRLHKIDMGSLLKTPEELFISEEEWAGKAFKEKRRQQTAGPKSETLVSPADSMEVEEPEQTWAGVDASVAEEKVVGPTSSYEAEGPEELDGVLKYVADAIIELDRRNRTVANRSSKPTTNGKGSLVNGNGPVSQPSVQEQSQGSVKSEETLDAHLRAATMTELSPSLSVTTQPTEDPTLRNLRLNLLALAKRAPLDTIARLPKDLVPEHIRHFVPTLGSSG